MESFIVLGNIPGTNVQIDFWVWLQIVAVCVLLYTLRYTEPIAWCIGVMQKAITLGARLVQFALTAARHTYHDYALPFLRTNAPILVHELQVLGERVAAYSETAYSRLVQQAHTARLKLLEKLDG